ncbi:MAG TPA: hypothetical protein VN408_32585, partial [Actinoplanes sp.]|nr:hypothetical protein [Actinoplanes sp.]
MTWSAVTILIVAVAALVAGGLVQGLLLWGSTRAIGRVGQDLKTAADPFYPAVLLAFQKRRRPGRLLTAAERHRRRGGRPGAEVPPDPVEREVVAWIRKRIPGWSRWVGAGLWRFTATSAFLVSMAGLVTFMVTGGMRLSDWELVPGGWFAEVILFYGGCEVVLVALVYLMHSIEKQWEERLARQCIGIVHTDLAGSFDAFLSEQRLELPPGLRATL